MNRKDFKKALIRLYASCGSYIMQCGASEKNGVYLTRFRHPTQKKIIEVTENVSEILCVLVYGDTYNASQRNCVECKTIEQFQNAVA